MKQKILLTVSFFLSTFSHSQTIEDQFSAPQRIDLTISTPQPRLTETFQITLDIEHLRANIFKSAAGKLRLSDDIDFASDQVLTMNVTALAKGWNEIGPLEFTLDKTRYTTNKIRFEVIDDLPRTNDGIWFRKIKTSDTTFCIIIEQRIPASGRTKENPDGSLIFTTEPEHRDIAKFKDSYSVNGLSGLKSNSVTRFSSIKINGENREFMFGYSIYYFNILDKNAKITITENEFENLPDGYRFENIIIQ